MNKYNKIKSIIFHVLNPSSKNNIIEKLFDSFIIILILLNIIASILESFQTIYNQYKTIFWIFELVSIMIFTMEYILRIWTANYLYNSQKILSSKIKFIFSPMAIIDLLAILPFYLPMLIPINLRFLRILRITRLLRVLKINRYTKAMNIIMKVLKKKREELIITLFITSILILLASSIMYYIENNVQPDKFPNIVASFWWAVATLTTVGYGDVFPVTIMGKLLSGIIAILGIGLVALPTGIISSGFLEEITNKNNAVEQAKAKYCHHCGEKLK